MAVVKIENLTYSYPESEKPALDNINLEIPEGQFVLIVGASGCGKSSLVRALAGLIPDFYGGSISGKVLLDGQDTGKMNRRSFVQKVGMLFQDPESQLVMTSVEEEIVFGLENLGLPNGLMKRRVMEVSSALVLSDLLRSFSPELSGGQKQKVALAAILAVQPEILILDEPTSQLDPISGEEILTMIRRLNEENGITVVLIEQRLERCFHLADRVLVMEQGKIIFDHHGPETIAHWAVKNNTPFIPPLAKLFAAMGFSRIPVTVKEGRKILRSFCSGTGSHINSSIKLEKKSCEIEKKAKNCLVEVEKLWFTYPQGKETLKGVDLKIFPGTFTVLMGENGAGKTTLFKILNGLIKPSRGQVRVLGQDTRFMSLEEMASVVSYLSQDPNDYLILPTVREELVFTLGNYGLDDNGIVKEISERLGLTNCLDENPRDLSSGERQRVALASVLVTRPQLLLLDEPTRGLDYRLKEELGKILCSFQTQGTTILMITHDVEFAAEYAEDIVLMASGTIVAKGSKFGMLTNSNFYSPQISKLFMNIEENVVTLEQGKTVLKKMLDSCGNRAVSL